MTTDKEICGLCLKEWELMPVCAAAMIAEDKMARLLITYEDGNSSHL